MLSIGFILLTHTNEAQALRLINALNLNFGDPAIVCHHDFSQVRFDAARFPSNVRFVRPHIQTQWGTISLVHAMLAGLRVLYERDPPDWFYLLSGADYPIRSGVEVIRELGQTPYDAYIRLKKVDHTCIPPRAPEDTGGLDSGSYLRLAYQRYIARSVPVPSWRHPHRGPAAMHLRLMNPWILRAFHPFTDSFHCYAGDQWFAANGRAAAALLSSNVRPLLKYFSGRFPPDEAFCPTVLGNAQELKMCSESKHYIRWERGHHPRSLNTDDLDSMLASRKHFARKFASGSSVLDALDKHLGIDTEQYKIQHA